MAEYEALSSCRRNFLLSEMGEEQSVVCAGCDICSGNQKKTAADGDEIISLVKSAQRFFTKEMLTETLRQKGWAEDEAINALKMLLSAGKIKKCGFPWKNRIFAD